MLLVHFYICSCLFLTSLTAFKMQSQYLGSYRTRQDVNFRHFNKIVCSKGDSLEIRLSPASQAGQVKVEIQACLNTFCILDKDSLCIKTILTQRHGTKMPQIRCPRARPCPWLCGMHRRQHEPPPVPPGEVYIKNVDIELPSWQESSCLILGHGNKADKRTI